MEDLAPRQREILEYIASAIDQKGIAPTYREIGDALGIRSTNGVSDHVKALVRKGYLSRPAGRGSARSLRLTQQAVGNFTDRDTVSVPLIGRVAAGLPLLADENYESSIRIDASLVPANVACFALEVAGESMIEDGILDGDVLDTAQITALADLPSREVLLATLLGTINAPATALARVLNEPATSLARVINAKHEG